MDESSQNLSSQSQRPPSDESRSEEEETRRRRWRLGKMLKTARWMNAAREVITRKKSDNRDEQEEEEEDKPSKLVIIFVLVVNIIPLAMILLGSLSWHSCPLDYMIPIWLIVAGCLYLLYSAVDLVVCYKRNSKRPLWASAADWLFALAMFGWLIAGSVWVYGSFSLLSSDSHSSFYCNPIAYYSSFAVITTAYVVIAVALLVLIGFFMATAACFAS